jgi:hypothetical protein
MTGKRSPIALPLGTSRFRSDLTFREGSAHDRYLRIPAGWSDASGPSSWTLISV